MELVFIGQFSSTFMDLELIVMIQKEFYLS